jgi:hypothetical protein
MLVWKKNSDYPLQTPSMIIYTDMIWVKCLASRINFYMSFFVPTLDITHTRQTAVPPRERARNHALGRAATGICSNLPYR